MNRKGDFTTTELLSVIVAVIGISLIGFGAVKLYGAVKNTEDENAVRILDSIMAKIVALEEGQGSEIIIQGFDGSENWYLVGWDKGDAPDKCFPDNCLCVCKGGYDKDYCQSTGFCESVDLGIVTESHIVREKGAVTGGSAEFAYDRDFVQLERNLLNLEVSRISGNYVLNYTSKEYSDNIGNIGFKERQTKNE